MIYLIAKYKIKKDKTSKVRKAILEFIRNVRKKERGNLRYEAYQLENDTEFIHFITFRDKKAENIHRQTKHVKKFVSILYPCCERKPKFIKLKEIK